MYKQTHCALFCNETVCPLVHARAGGRGRGLVCFPALIAGYTPVSIHDFRVLLRPDINSIIYIITNTCFDINLSRKSRRKPHNLVATHCTPCHAPIAVSRPRCEAWCFAACIFPWHAPYLVRPPAPRATLPLAARLAPWLAAVLMSVPMSAPMSICLSPCLSICLSPCLSPCLSLCLPLCLSHVSPYVCPYVSPYVCPYVSP